MSRPCETCGKIWDAPFHVCTYPPADPPYAGAPRTPQDAPSAKSEGGAPQDAPEDLAALRAALAEARAALEELFAEASFVFPAERGFMRRARAVLLDPAP